jgi:putative CocE/NonD family hydrolase
MHTIETFPHAVRMLDPVWISLADGVRLAARLWLPEDAEARPVPAILEYLPYRLRDGTAIRDALTHPYFAGHGYASVRVDIRGTGDSDGLLLDEYLKQEQDDCLEVIDWITRQPWCSGQVGMIGISWGGFNGLQVAARRPAALKAVVSLCSTDDRYADDVHYMGGALLTDNLRWASTMFGFQTRPPDPAVVGEQWRAMWLARMEAEPLLIRTWLQHPTRDYYWKHGSVCEAPEAITAAVYLVGGWADSYSNAVSRMLERLTCPRKGLIGPWAHKYPHFATPGPAIGFLQEALRWWGHWLKGVPTGVTDEPAYRVWIEDYVAPNTDHAGRPGRWVAESQWPSARIVAVPRNLGAGVLGWEPVPPAEVLIASPQDVGEAGGNWCAYGSGGELPGDQRIDDGRSVCFDSAPLAAPLEIVGAPELIAAITPDRPDALLIARLCDVAPDGASLRVSFGVLNLTHRDGHEDPHPLVPGEPVRVRVRLNDCAHAFAPGHRIRLACSTAYWPMVWPSPAPASLRLDTATSRLILPIRPPAEEDAALSAFAEPEAAAPLARTILRAPERRRRAKRDHLTGETVFEERDDTGRYRIDSTGLEYALSSESRFSIHPGDPLSARAEVIFFMEQGRDDWQVRAVTRTVMRATAEAFLIEGTLDAWEGETRLLSRNWRETIPRHRV